MNAVHIELAGFEMKHFKSSRKTRRDTVQYNFR